MESPVDYMVRAAHETDSPTAIGVCLAQLVTDGSGTRMLYTNTCVTPRGEQKPSSGYCGMLGLIVGVRVQRDILNGEGDYKLACPLDGDLGSGDVTLTEHRPLPDNDSLGVTHPVRRSGVTIILWLGIVLQAIIIFIISVVGLVDGRLLGFL